MRKLTILALVLVAGTAIASQRWEFVPDYADPIPAMQLEIEGRQITTRDVASWWSTGETFGWSADCVMAKNEFNKWLNDAYDYTTLSESQNDAALAGYAGIATYNASLAAVDVVTYCNPATAAAACASVNGLMSLQMNTCGTGLNPCRDREDCIEMKASCLVATQCESNLENTIAILCP